VTNLGLGDAGFLRRFPCGNLGFLDRGVRSIFARRVSSSLAMRQSVTTRSAELRAFSMNSAPGSRIPRPCGRARFFCRTSAFGGDAGDVAERWLVMRALSISSRARSPWPRPPGSFRISFLPGFALGGDAGFGNGLIIAIRAFSIAWRCRDLCLLGFGSPGAFAPTSVRCRARRTSMSALSSRAVSLSRRYQRLPFGSRLRVRILIIESCSMSFAASLASMSPSLGQPSASKRFDG